MATYVQRAIATLPGFGQSYEKFSKQLLVEQYSYGSIIGYSSKLAAICLHFGKVPESLTSDDCRDYFSELLSRRPSPGLSYFKHTVYSLRCYFRIMNLPLLQLSLPRIRREKKLAVVLSQWEMSKLLCSSPTLRDKALLALAYSSGLRLSEVRNMKLSDIDSGRMMIHIRQGKGRKDRYVPLSHSLLVVLRAYYREERPTVYLFNSSLAGKPITGEAINFILHSAVRAAGIQKHVVLHTLRHSYATHLLEMGENILRIKELLGHSNIKTTMAYLHLVPLSASSAFSPLDRLFPINKQTPEE
jgi:integrase/recombinase XerD